MQQRFSYQLYSSRNHLPVEKTLAMLARHGFSEVEGFGGVYDDPAALRKSLDANGLTMPTGHFLIEMMEGDKPQVLTIARTLGMNQLIVPYLMPDDRPTTAQGWEAFGKRLNAIARTYRSEGFGVAWHNHDFEFVPFPDGKTPHELIFANAPLLDWEIDVAWIARAKADPLKWIRQYRGAITVAHVKDIAPQGQNTDEDGWADVGDGVVNWKDVLAALADTRCTHWVLEHDNPKDDERFAKRSIAACKKL
jgi:sugar phosphate isomerase/epimerase